MSDGQFFVDRYYKDPLRYVKEVIGVQIIEDWQKEVLEYLAQCANDSALPRRIAVRSGHGVGKTALMAWLNKWFMITRPDPQVVVTANTENQLSTKTWRELAKWNKASKDGELFQHTATRFFLKESPVTWCASAIPWSEHNSEAFAGTHEKHLLYQFDEASSIPEIIWDVSEGAMTTGGAYWIVFGNPTKNTGRFAECFGKYRHRWKTFEVDSRTVSIADKAQIQRWAEDEGEDSDFFRVRVRGLPPRSSMLEFIGAGDVEDCIKYQAEGYESFPKVLGIDIARFGDDSNVVVMRQGRKVTILDTWSGIDGMQSASRIIELIQSNGIDATFIDEGGVGGPVLDRVKAIVGGGVFGVNFGFSAKDDKKWFNKRSEMWGNMRDAIRSLIDLPENKNLKTDLTAPLYSFSPKEQIKLERKEDMKKRGYASPDYGDALALTYAENVTKAKKEFKYVDFVR